MGSSFYKLEHVPARYIQHPIKEHNDKYMTMPYTLDESDSYNECFVRLSKQFLNEQIIEISTNYDLSKLTGLNKDSPNYKVEYFSSIDQMPYRLRQYAPQENGLIIMGSDGSNIRFMGSNDATDTPKEVLAFIETSWYSKGYYSDKFDEFLNKYDTYIIFPEMLEEFKQCFPMSCPIQEWVLNKNEIIYISM